MHECRVRRDVAHVLQRPVGKRILHQVRVQEAVGVALPYVEAPRVMQPDVRRDVVWLARVLAFDASQQCAEARLAGTLSPSA